MTSEGPGEQKLEAGSWEPAGGGDRSLPAPPLKARDTATVGQVQGAAPEGHHSFAHGAREQGGRWQPGVSGNRGGGRRASVR